MTHGYYPLLFLLAITAAVDSALDSADVDPEVKEKAISLLRSNTSMFTGLETSYQRNHYYKTNFGLVEPTKIVLGTERKAKGYGHKRRVVEKRGGDGVCTNSRNSPETTNE